MPKLIRLKEMPSRVYRPHKADLAPWEPGRTARRVLELLHEYRYMTPSLAGMVYEHRHSRGRSNVPHELTRLWRHGYAERFYRPAEWGSSQHVYVLSVDGAHVVIEPKDWPDERRKVYNTAKQKTNYEHALAVTLLHGLWEVGSAGLEELFTTVTIWQDKDGQKDRVRNRFTAQVDGEDVRIEPDLTVLIAHQQRGYYRPLLFEVERSHKNYERQRQRFQAYEDLLSRRGERVVQDVFSRESGITPERGMAVFVAEDRGHAERLRRSAQDIVRADTELWFTSLDQLLEVKTRCKKDGTAYTDRNGKPQQHEVPITPAAFFSRQLLTALDGKQGTLVV
jgi:hypothetical protein